MKTAPTVPPWMRIAVVVWLLGFLFVFFNQVLPNNRPFTRWDVWTLVPFALMDAIDPPQSETSLPRGLSYLGQRLPLWGLATLIVAGAWGWGVLVQRYGLSSVCHWLGQCLRIEPPVTEAGYATGLASRIPDGLSGWTPLERHYFACLLGLSFVSLIVLALGLVSALSAILLGTVLTLGLMGGVWLILQERTSTANVSAQSSRGFPWWLLVVAPFLAGILLGSLSPSTDFDVNEYHLGGPKEWFLNGRITFLPHNIYTSFPFLTEMLLLAGMVLAGDWFWGALAGQAVLAALAPLTAVGLYAAGRRWHSETTGRIAAIVYLSTPWVFRMSIIAYADGGLMTYASAAALAAWGMWQRLRDGTTGSVIPPVIDRGLRRDVMLTGLLAGSAMACKYTGLVMAVLPMGLAVTVAAIRHGRGWKTVIETAVVFSLGVGLTIGPWMLKNTIETGNPVYPLGYSVFGGRDLDDALALKWKRGHARPSAGSVRGEARSLVMQAYDVAAVNDWQSPLVFALAPLVLLKSTTRRRAVFPMAITAWLFLAWWLFTHHIDRFWLPLLPTAALLAGMGAGDASEHMGRWLIRGVIAVGVVFNLGFCATGFVGYNVGLTELNAARDFVTRRVSPEIALLNDAAVQGELPSTTKVLLVGEAAVFPMRFSYVYNTVFDRSLFEEWCGQPGDMASQDRPLRTADEIRATLNEKGITHLYINWGEIWRYRQTYGYTDFVHPARFQSLIDAGVLTAPVAMPEGLGRRPVVSLSSTEETALRQWAPQLFIHGPDGEDLITAQFYTVRTHSDRL